MVEVLLSLGLVVLACIGIMFSCNVFEPAADYLGRNMKEGVKGATINAVGSSLPELFTTLIFLVWYHEVDGFTAGVATTAGSAVFNAVLIPASAILAVTVIAKLTTSVEVSRKVLIRDGTFVLIAEIVLIYFLGLDQLHWWMGVVMMGIYAVYFAVLMLTGGGEDEDEEEEEEEEDEIESRGFFGDLVTAMKGDDVELSTGKAWAYLGISVIFVGVFCALLVESTKGLAEAWGVPLFITTVVFAAAATSVPDTVLSIKDALKGNYDDAVANAIGSNIFDVCVSLGLPLTIFCLMTGSSIDMSETAGQVAVLRWVMLGFTIGVLLLFLRGKVGKVTGGIMTAMYVGWLGYIGYIAFTGAAAV